MPNALVSSWYDSGATIAVDGHTSVGGMGTPVSDADLDAISFALQSGWAGGEPSDDELARIDLQEQEHKSGADARAGEFHTEAGKLSDDFVADVQDYSSLSRETADYPGSLGPTLSEEDKHLDKLRVKAELARMAAEDGVGGRRRRGLLREARALDENVAHFERVYQGLPAAREAEQAQRDELERQQMGRSSLQHRRQANKAEAHSGGVQSIWPELSAKVANGEMTWSEAEEAYLGAVSREKNLMDAMKAKGVEMDAEALRLVQEAAGTAPGSITDPGRAAHQKRMLANMGVGLAGTAAQAGLTFIPTAADKRNKERLADLHAMKGRMGQLSPEQEEALGYMDDAAGVAIAEGHERAASRQAANRDSLSAGDVERLRSTSEEQGIKAKMESGAKRADVRLSNIKDRMHELERRTAQKAMRGAQREALAHQALAGAAGSIGAILGGRPGQVGFENKRQQSAMKQLAKGHGVSESDLYAAAAPYDLEQDEDLWLEQMLADNSKTRSRT